MRAAGLLFVIAALMLLAALLRAPAESQETASTELLEASFVSEGGESASSSFGARSTTGELSTGDMTGAAFGVGSGFWAAANCIDDGDGLNAAAEALLGTNSCAFDTDDDRQGDGVDACPTKPTIWLTPLGDEDCDGFESAKETFMGTLALVACAANAWPPDFNDDKTVNIIDVGAMRTVFNSQQGDGRYVARKDLNADGFINIIDIGALRPFFGKSCTP